MANKGVRDCNRPTAAKDTQVYMIILKTILWVYIALCIIIAGINYGYAQMLHNLSQR